MPPISGGVISASTFGSSDMLEVGWYPILCFMEVLNVLFWYDFTDVPKSEVPATHQKVLVLLALASSAGDSVVVLRAEGDVWVPDAALSSGGPCCE